MYAEVVVPLSVDGVFSYFVPPEFVDEVKPGSLVVVSFGGNRRYAALVTALSESAPKGVKTRSIEGMADRSIHFSENHISFLRWAWEYYMASPGDLLRAALPAPFRKGDFTYKGDIERVVVLRVALEELKSRGVYEEMLEHTPAQARVLNYFISSGRDEIPRKEVLSECKGNLAALRALSAKGILAEEEREPWRGSGSGASDGSVDGVVGVTVGVADGSVDSGVGSAGLGGVAGDVATDGSGADASEVVLSPVQAEALSKIEQLFETKDSVLLHGVSSSGKTEIYIKLISEAISKGGQALILMPEITLTSYMVNRLKRTFGDAVGIYHSGMTDGERAALWKRECSDSPYRVILGVRSAILLPFSSLRLVVVDEEHDLSYKQQEPTPRYHGRDSAVMLAKLHSAKVLLGSATPSFESYHNALIGKYGLVELNERYGGSERPEIIIENIGEVRRKKMMKGSFSPALIAEMERTLKEGGQVILYQNRRGYSTYVRCNHCGDIPRCTNCDVSLTYYKSRSQLVCRYCGRTYPLNSKCNSCGEGEYVIQRPGTEFVEEECAKLFPQYHTVRADLDVMSTKGGYASSVADFEEGRSKILVGSNMVSKGLDFGGVKLVGVLDADQLIHFPDFRSEERAASQLMQLAGRCGRRFGASRVVIQSAEPENRIFEWLRSGDYRAMYDTLSKERRAFAYPPFCRLIKIELRDSDETLLRNFANNLVAKLRALPQEFTTRVEGPAVPDIAVRSGMSRVEILLKVSNGNRYGDVKREVKRIVGEERSSVRVIFDVDCV